MRAPPNALSTGVILMGIEVFFVLLWLAWRLK
jgi:hypothetical protein